MPSIAAEWKGMVFLATLVAVGLALLFGQAACVWNSPTNAAVAAIDQGDLRVIIVRSRGIDGWPPTGVYGGSSTIRGLGLWYDWEGSVASTLDFGTTLWIPYFVLAFVSVAIWLFVRLRPPTSKTTGSSEGAKQRSDA